jgi:hypothetical protein
MGNHEHAYLKHNYMLPSQYICEQMFGTNSQKKHFGYSARVILPIKIQDTIFRVPIYLDHGFGSSVTRTDGGDITTYCKHCQQYNADINAYGHRHKTWYFENVRFHRDGHKIHEYCVLCAGTFLRTLSNNEDPTYSEIKGYPLYPIGCMSVHLVARKRSKNKYYLERFHKKLPQGEIE